MDATTYRQLLAQIRDLLLSVGDDRWGPRLQSWVAEFDALADSDDLSMTEHIRRTRRSVAGMGSIGDVVICTEAGHRVPEEEAEVLRLNAQLENLVHSLFLTIAKLLKEEE